MAKTIHCVGCGARMRLSPELLDKIAGRTGRITCKVCSTRLRLDARAEELQVELEDASARVSAAALLSRPSGDRVTPTAELESPSPREAAPFLGVSLPPPLPRIEPSEDSTMIPSLAELAKRSISSRPARPLRKRAPDARDPLERAASGSLSPYVLVDGDDEPPVFDESSPYTASHPESEILAIYGGVKQRHASDMPTPFERKGMLASSLPLSGTIQLTADGRLVNASDRPASSRRGWIGQGVGLAALALVGVALGAIAVRPEVRALWQDPKPPVAPAATGAVAPATIVKEPEAPRVAEVVAPEIEVRAEPEAPEVSPNAPVAPASPELAAAPARKERNKKEARAESVAEVSAAPAPDEAPPAEPRAAASEAEAPVELGPFREDVALVALQEATAHASSCRKEGDPSGTARVVVTFAPSGRVTSATISGPPFAGTETGSCVASRFRGAAVPPFAGNFVTVTKTVVIQ